MTTTPEELTVAAQSTAKLIEAIKAGTITAPSVTLHRLEGAYTVLSLLASGESRLERIVAHLAPAA